MGRCRRAVPLLGLVLLAAVFHLEVCAGPTGAASQEEPEAITARPALDEDDDYDDADLDDESDESYLEDAQALKPSEADRQLELFKSELECPGPEYEKMKDRILFHYEKEMRGRYSPGKELLLSLLFMHLDRNMDGFLDEKELDKVSSELHADWSEQCRPSLLIIHHDTENDLQLSHTEFIKSFNKTKLAYPIEGVSVVSLDRELQWVQRRVRRGDNVELRCDVTGSPAPPIVWERNGVYLGSSKPAGSAAATPEPPHYPAMDLGLRVFDDSSLFIPNVQMYHAGNYSCYATRNREVVQNHRLNVYTMPTVSVEPRVQTRQPKEDAVVFCHVTGEPFPQVQWLKSEEPLRATDPRKYVTVGNGSELRIRHVDFADTGAYFCQAKSTAGATRDMSTLIVMREDTQALKLQTMQHRFFVFHDRGVSIHDPRTCRTQFNILPTTMIPDTQSSLCSKEADAEPRCQWGEALNVENRFIYVTQPTLDRVLVLSVPQMAVVEVIATDKNPVRLHAVPHTGQVWILNWRSDQDQGTKTIQIIRDAVERKRHVAVHLEPVHGQLDLIQGLFMPPFGRDLMRGVQHGYVSHSRHQPSSQSLFKLDLTDLRYSRSVDLSAYSCVPADLAFSALYGYVFVRCQDPFTGRDSKLLLMDYLTDAVISEYPNLGGKMFVTPDSRKLVILQNAKQGVDILIMRITEEGLPFHFDVKSTLNVSDIAFYPSTSSHGYDLFATTVDKEDLLFLDLFTGTVEMVTGAGKPLPVSRARWGMPNRPIFSPVTFDRYLVTPGYDAVFVINGYSRSVNCEIGGLDDPRLVSWTNTMPQ